jgi:GT2 family glycosyltransferase
MKVFVLLPVHNRWSFTRQFLDSLAEQERGQDTSVVPVVIDDGSTDQTAIELAHYPDVHVLVGDGTLWWAGCIQRGLQWALPQVTDEDLVYLANNDTILDPSHLSALIRAMQTNKADFVGSVSFEIWPDGHHHPVSTAFAIDHVNLNVTNIAPNDLPHSRIDALAGRGLLMSAAAARALRLQPHRLPQHFADIAATAALISRGFTATVETNATSIQLERAGSSIEFKPTIASMLDKKSALYLPALTAFWWDQLTPVQRVTLMWRFPVRALRQVTGGHYALK